ncbi:hypothetical protein LOAG_14443 [Loa loa]|nr:hypothetical protein LOAG_14443 [Loa loa]EFO14083.1 hypothetical protein LOAG_14443 [Loa loa]
MFSHTFSFTVVVIILCVNLTLVSCGKISDANMIRKRDKRQFYGGHHFGSISVPFFNFAWGRHYNGWHAPWYYNYGWRVPYPFGPHFGIRRRFWRRRWENWDGYDEGFRGHGPFHGGFGGHGPFHGGFGGPWFA